MNDIENDFEPVYTLEQVADHLKISVDYLYREVRSGNLPHIRHSRKFIRVTSSQLDAYMRGRLGRGHANIHGQGHISRALIQLAQMRRRALEQELADWDAFLQLLDASDTAEATREGVRMMVHRDPESGKVSRE